MVVSDVTKSLYSMRRYIDEVDEVYITYTITSHCV